MKELKLTLAAFVLCFILIYVSKLFLPANNVQNRETIEKEQLQEEVREVYHGVFFDASYFRLSTASDLDKKFGEPVSIVKRLDGSVRTYDVNNGEYYGDFYMNSNDLCVRVDMLPGEPVHSNGTLLGLLGISDTAMKCTDDKGLVQRYDNYNENGSIKHVDVYRDSIDKEALWYADIFYDEWNERIQ